MQALDTVEIPSLTTKPIINMQRWAWMILVSSTILFCSSAIAVTGGAYYFFFRSYIPMDVTVEVSRGTAGLVASDFSEQIIRQSANYPRSRTSTLSTDTQSQATLSFRMIGDGEYQPVLATITLENDSALMLTRASRPRFRWSDGIYWIELDDVKGEIDIFVSRAADRPFVLQIHSQFTSDVIRIDDPGRYSYESDETQLRLATREGEASFITANLANNRLVTRGQEAVLFIGRGAPFVTDSPQNLLENSLFAFEVTDNPDDPIPPLRWGCFEEHDALPAGRSITDLWDGRSALRLIRTDDAQSHGETGCRQDFGAGGRDVTAYTYLELQSTFLINFQSLGDCGQVGSECPLMLLMEYTDVNGDNRQWLQGFYFRHDPQLQYPSVCVTCARVYQPHRLINEKVWHTFETGNLFDLLSGDERPATINRLEFYASGHQYDVFVSEVVLLAGQTEVMPPNDNIAPISVTPTGGQ